jgi:tetratricopeptide (TPR) repeat protein
LARAPNREQALTWAAEAAYVLDRLDVAEVYRRRLVANYPHSPSHHERLAEVLEKRKAWPEAIAEAREAIRGDPFRAESRGILIAALLASGDGKQAREELAVVGVIDPAYQKELRERFAELSTPGK